MTKSKPHATALDSSVVMNNERPAPDGDDIISKGTAYFRIDRAAALLGCTSEDLLHLGATGNAEIIAPVIAGGGYEWPVAWDGTPFPDLEPSFHAEFNAADRVILSAFDLAKIEGIGWTIPTFFCAPAKAREVTENWHGSAFFGQGELSAPEPQGLGAETGDGVDGERADHSPERVFTDADVIAAKSYRPNRGMPKQWHTPNPKHEKAFLKRMDENAVSIPWYAVNPVARHIDDAYADGLDAKVVNDKIAEFERNRPPAEKTTIAHLFIAKPELLRLKSGLPQNDAALERNKQMQAQAENKRPHGGAERFAIPRVPVLQAAIYCAAKEPALFQNATEWTTRIFQTEARGIWRRQGTITLRESTIEGLLRDAVNGRFTRPAD